MGPTLLSRLLSSACVFLFVLFQIGNLAASNRSTYIPYASGVSAPMVFDAAHQQVFVAWTDLDRVEVISAADYHVIHTIRVPSPSAVDISPDGSTVAIATSGAHILFFNTTTYVKTDDVVLRKSALGISQLLYVGNGNLMVRAEEGLSTGGGITAYWDHNSNSFTNTSNAMSVTGPYYTSGVMARSGDYSRVIMGEPISNGPVQIVDANTGSVLKTMEFGWYISGVAVNRDASRYAVCVSGSFALLDASFNAVYQDQSGCEGMTFSADGSTLYRDIVSGSTAYTQALNVTTLASHNTTNQYSQQLYSTAFKTADNSGMVYGVLPLSPSGRAFVAVDTTQSSTGTASTSDPVHILQVIDSIGSAKGGDEIRILCTGLDNTSASSVTVTIGGAPASKVTIAGVDGFMSSATLSNMRILAVSTPPGTSGLADVTVRTGGGSDTATKAFQYASTTMSFPFATSPTFLVYDNFRKRLYASNITEVEVIDVATQQVLSPLFPASGKLTGSQFEGLSLSPDGARLYIADPGTKLIHVLNLNSPGTGTSIDPGALLGNPQSVLPSRVYEMASGKVIGSDGGLPTGGTYSPGVFILDVSSGTGNWWTVNSSQGSALLWGTSEDGKYLYATNEVNGLSSAQSYLYDDSKGQWSLSDGQTNDSMEATLSGDGTVSAVGGSTPGIGNLYPEIVDQDLNALGQIQDVNYVMPPAGTPSLSFQSSGALLYKAGVDNKLTEISAQAGRVAIYDVQHSKAIGSIVFPDVLSTSYTPAITHMFTADDAGRTFFSATPSGITMMVLHDVPLSVGHLQPTFAVQGSGQTITIRGSGFLSGSTVSFEGVQSVSTFVDSNTLTAVAPSSLSAGWHSVTVENPDGSSYLLADAFQVLGTQPATPVINGFSPAQVAIEAAIGGMVTPLPVTVLGSGFDRKDVVEIQGVLVDSSFTDSSHIQALIPAEFSSSTGSVSVVVTSPYAGDSNTGSLEMVNPVPVAQSVSPSSLVTGANGSALSVYGTGFVTNSQVLWNGQPLSTTLVQGKTSDGLEALFATVPAALIASDGTANISIYNPAPAGGTSSAVQVVIEPAHPVVVLPSSIDFGSILVNTTTSQSLQIANSGTADYVLTSATVTSGPFTVDAGCIGFAVKPFYGCGMTLHFAPTAVGSATGTLVLVDNTKGSPHTITLTGVGRSAVTRHVPTDLATIQAAIDASSDGDTVIVGAGTYAENVDFKGKSISVISSDGATKTIIDAGKNGNGVTMKVVDGTTGKTPVLTGFTIQNAAGAGVFVGNLSATITNNKITNNLGYGIQLNFAGAVIQGNTISNTKTNVQGINYGCDWSDGVGIAAGGTNNAGYGLTITGNTIENNAGQCEGAGIQLYAAPSAIITNNVIRNNQALGEGGAISLMNGNKITLLQNLIYGNQSGAAGGAIYLALPSEVNYSTGPLTSFITNNTIVRNTLVPNPLLIDDYMDGSQVAFGGAASQVGFFNNIILANDAYAAIACYPVYSYLSGTAPVAIYNDLQNLKGTVFGGWCTTPSGSGPNISADPKFANASTGDYHLLTGSPAIDAGYNAALGVQSQDLDGNARIQNGAGSPRVDLGVYEFAGSADARAATNVSLVAQNGTVNYGASVVLSATVKSGSSAVTSGTVSLLDNWTQVAQATVDQNGNVTFSTSSLSAGQHNLIAAFNGTSEFQESTSPNVQFTIQGYATSTALSFSTNPITYGQQETITATVTSTTGTPAGTLTFVVNDPSSRQVTVPLDANGVATYNTNALGAGTDYIQAIYSAQGGFLESRSTNLPLQVQKSQATLSLAASSGTIVAGQAVTFTATVTAPGTLTGTINFNESSGSSIGSGILSAGTATFLTTSLKGGAHTITAYYPGDNNHLAATSSSTTVVVRDFSVSADTGSVTVSRGGSITTAISVAPVSGFTGTVTMTCAVPYAMYEASCSVTSVQLSDSSTQNAILTVNTAAPHQAVSHPALRFTMWTGTVFGIALIGQVFGRKRRKAVGTTVLSILLLGVFMSISCGGGNGSGSGGGGSTDQGTPAGTYTLTITATSGTATHNVTQTVVVR